VTIGEKKVEVVPIRNRAAAADQQKPVRVVRKGKQSREAAATDGGCTKSKDCAPQNRAKKIDHGWLVEQAIAMHCQQLKECIARAVGIVGAVEVRLKATTVRHQLQSQLTLPFCAGLALLKVGPGAPQSVGKLPKATRALCKRCLWCSGAALGLIDGFDFALLLLFLLLLFGSVNVWVQVLCRRRNRATKMDLQRRIEVN
jgi:hypothetical protein